MLKCLSELTYLSSNLLDGGAAECRRNPQENLKTEGHFTFSATVGVSNQKFAFPVPATGHLLNEVFSQLS